MFFGPFQLTSCARTQSRIPPSLWRQCKGSIATFLTLCPIFHGAPSMACFFGPIRKMPRKKGLLNYKNNLLINIIEEILPNGELGWEAVAIAYQGKLNEEMQQDTININKHCWMKKMCNGMKKAMGRTGLSWQCQQHVGDTSATCQKVAKFGSTCNFLPTQKVPQHKNFALEITDKL